MDSIFVLSNSVEERGRGRDRKKMGERRRAAKREEEMIQTIEGVYNNEGSGMDWRKEVHLTLVTKSQLGPQLLQVSPLQWDCFIIFNTRC